MIHGTPRKPVKLGTVQTVNMDTGEVLAEQRNALTLLPPGGDVCQECAVAHNYYQQHFYATHGRWPTWSDAMAHCTDAVKAQWRKGLIASMRRAGIEVPLDLLDVSPAAGR